MASMQGLPPLPKSLRGLLDAGSEHWKETEKIIQLKTSIQSDMGADGGVTVAVANGETHEEARSGGGEADSTAEGDTGETELPTKSHKGCNNLESTIAFLRHEMVRLLFSKNWGKLFLSSSKLYYIKIEHLSKGTSPLFWAFLHTLIN